jgi:dihydrofolate reductase
MSMLWIMAKLIYSAIASLDGYVNDSEGNFDWAAPDEAVHAFVNDEERPVGTYLYGRLMYETMAVWETLEDPAPAMRDFAQIWRAADKIVYSRTLDAPSTPRTTLEREFDAGAVRRLKETSERDLSVGGPHLAAHAIRAGLVDECRLYLSPIVVGGGTRALPDEVRWPLQLLDERRFANGVVYLRYGASTSGRS